MNSVGNPSLYQVNTRVTLTRLSLELGRHARLDDIPDSELDRIQALGFDWIWLLGVWQTGEAGRRISLSHEEWLREYVELLGDFTEQDVPGSCFAIQSYTVHSDFGGEESLLRLRKRIERRGLRLMLDFVPNHTAPDHPWVRDHPDFYVHGAEADLAAQPQNYTTVETPGGTKVLAYGRDPYFDGWPDTLQLNYANPDLWQAMAGELRRIGTLCDGVRCDMAMLILPDVFERTWGLRPRPFWPDAVAAVRAAKPDFVFMAEVYWDLEWTLQQQGFDYTYDKRLYDRLVEGHPGPIRDHFRADLDYQRSSARFLENHDEPRSAATFEFDKHQAAAILTYFCPGLRFVHNGQMEGWSKRIPVHLGRGPVETINTAVLDFYTRLLACVASPVTREGEWRLLEVSEAWPGNGSHDSIVGFAWGFEGVIRRLVFVNYAPHHSQCYARLPFPELAGHQGELIDLMGPEAYERDGDELGRRGLYLDLRPWGYNVFDVTSRVKPSA